MSTVEKKGFGSLFDAKRGVKFNEVLFECVNDVLGLSREEFFGKRWRKWEPADEVHTVRPWVQPTANALNEEWLECRDANWLYSHPEYKWDSIACSIWGSTGASQAGLNLLFKEGFTDPKYIFDWGAGCGLTSLLLAKNFPNAEVHFSEINEDLIAMFEWFKDRSGLENIHHVRRPVRNDYDLVQALEIVEHIPWDKRERVGDPMTELLNILEHASDDAKFILCSDFKGELKWTALGHFISYWVAGKEWPYTHMHKPIEEELERHGWNFLVKGFNGVPRLFTKGEHTLLGEGYMSSQVKSR